MNLRKHPHISLYTSKLSLAIFPLHFILHHCNWSIHRILCVYPFLERGERKCWGYSAARSCRRRTSWWQQAAGRRRLKWRRTSCWRDSSTPILRRFPLRLAMMSSWHILTEISLLCCRGTESVIICLIWLDCIIYLSIMQRSWLLIARYDFFIWRFEFVYWLHYYDIIDWLAMV